MLQSVTEDDIPLLKALVPLNTLQDAELTALLETLEIKSSAEGSVLFEAGDTDTGNLYLLSGRIELLAGESVVDVIIAGAATARFPIAHQFPRKYKARARTAVRYVVVESHLLGRLLEKDRRDALRADGGNAEEGTADWIGKLLQSRIFQSLPKEALQAVLQRMRAIEVHAGDELIREGEPGDYFYLLDRGEALVSRDGEQLAVLHGGDMFGEEALLGDVPRGASVGMRSDGRVLRLDRESFRQLVKLPVLRRCDVAAVPELVASGCVLLDVRDPEAFAQGHPVGAVNLPFDSLRYQAASLAHERCYVVCGDVPGHSLVACYLLTERGFDVTAMDGDVRTLEIDDEHSVSPSSPPERSGAGDADGGGVASRTRHQGLAADYRLQIDDLGARLEAANRRCEQFAAQRDALRDRLDALERQARTRQADEQFRESFDQRLKAQQAQSDALETELELMRRLEVDARNEARKQHRESTRLAEALRARDEALQSLTNERDQAVQHAETLAARGEGRDDAAAGDEARRALRRTQLDLEYRLGVATDKLNEAEEQARKRQRQRDRDVATLSDKIAGLERQLRDSGRAFIDANSRYKEAEQAYQEQIALLEARLQRQAAAGLDDEAVARNDRERLVLLNQLDEQEARTSGLDEEVADLRRQLQASTEEAAELREIIETYAADLEAARGQADDAQVEALKAELALVREQAEEELERMASQLGLAREAGDDNLSGSVELEQLRQQLSIAQRALREREEALENAHDERQFLEDSLEDRDRELDRATGRLAELEASLRDNELRMSELDAEIARSKAALAKCHQERDAIQAADFRDARFAATSPSDTGATARRGAWFSGLLGGLVLAGAGAWLGWYSGWLPLPASDGAKATIEPISDVSGVDEAPPATEAHYLPTRGGPLSPVAVRERLADGSLGPAMRQLSGSLFLMGSDASWAPQNARPRHSVSVGGFWISEHEVSVAEYQRFVRATGRRAPTDFGWRGDDLPVTGVSWEDADAYAVWLSRQTGKHYRLPSESEWEYAAAGGSTARYWWGEQPQKGKENCADCGTRYDDRQPAPIGSFSANGFGLFDVAGNVMEWVEDCYRANYRVRLADADCRRHVFRGGSFHRPLAQLITVARGQGSPDMRMPYLGFRVVRDD